jgi:hypothetical protein
MRIVTVALVAVVGALAVQAALAAHSSSFRMRLVPCTESIDETPFPYVGDSRPERRYRLVLAAFSVPPAFLRQTVSTDERPWAYWSKSGMVTRGDGRPMTVTVPRNWRDRVAIAWGDGGHGVFQSIRFAGCDSGPSSGNAFAGGFFLRSPSACVPLVFRVGTRSAVVRFGVGRRCP